MLDKHKETLQGKRDFERTNAIITKGTKQKAIIFIWNNKNAPFTLIRNSGGL